MVKREVEFQDSGCGVFAVGVLLDQRAQRLQRLEGKPLIAPDLVNLVVVAERQQVLGVCGVFVGRIEINIALRGGPAFRIIATLMAGIRLHDQRPSGPAGIGVEPFDFREIESRIFGAVAREFKFAAFENLLRGISFKRQCPICRRPAATAASGQQGRQDNRAQNFRPIDATDYWLHVLPTTSRPSTHLPGLAYSIPMQNGFWACLAPTSTPC